MNRTKKKAIPILRLILDHRAQWPGLIAITLIALLAGVLKTQSAVFWGKAVDAGVSGNIQLMWASVLTTLGLIALDALRTAIQFWAIGQTTERLFLAIRKMAYAVLLRGDVATLQKNMRSGDMAMRVSSDCEQLCNNIAADYPEYIRRGFMAVMAIVVGLFLSWQLLLLYIVILPISIKIVNAMAKPIQQQRKKTSESTGRATSFASEVMLGLATVKSFGLKAEMNRRFGIMAQQAYEQSIKTVRVSAHMTMIKQLSSVVQIMSLFLVGSLLIRSGHITLGNMLAFVVMSAYINEAFDMIDRMLAMLRSSMALAERLYEVLDIPYERGGTSHPLPQCQEAVVAMEHVSFTYGDQPILKDVSLKLEPNQKIGIIGPSGCGKSTLIRLICGFYAPSSGQLRLFGQPSDLLDLDALRGDMALITQDASLFHGTIGENVRYGHPGATDDGVLTALQHAALSLDDFPEREHTQVGEFGSRLSGGQRQRVSIARAFLKNAKLILLDEATSALDMHTEAEVQHALDSLLMNQAAIIVAHRLSTVKDVDYLYCMDDGRVIEEGDPSTLLKAKGYYYRMCCQQGLIGGDEDA